MLEATNYRSIDLFQVNVNQHAITPYKLKLLFLIYVLLRYIKQKYN